MSDINWGILQPGQQMQPVRAAAPVAQSNGSVAPMPSGASGLINPAQMQELAIERQRLQMEQARQPGLLQGQELQNQGQGLLNTQKQQEIDANNYAIKVRQEIGKTFAENKNKGGITAGFDAAAQRYAELGDTDSAQKLYTTNEQLTQLKEKGAVDELANTATQIYAIQKDEKPPTIDPKTGQVVDPGVTGLDLYKQRYGVIKQINHNAPDPDSFKNDAQFEETYVHPVLEHGLSAIQQKAAEQKAALESDMGKANAVVNKALQDYQTAIKTHGANSAEAQQAKINLQNAQKSAVKVANPSSPVTGAIQNITSGTDASNVVNAATQQATGQPATAPAPAPASRTPKNVTFNLLTGKLE